MKQAGRKRRRNSRQQKRQRQTTIQKAILTLIFLAIILTAVIVILALTKKKPEDNPETTTLQIETETSEEEQETEEDSLQPKVDDDGSITGSNGQMIYLTFDDGPGESTYQLLDILDTYNIKATFFVLRNEYREEEYREIIRRGHEIGVHSTSHDYGILYADIDAFIEDVSTCRDYVENVTGHRLFLYRFPGGTNNQVHDVSISRCIEYLQSVGLTHFDWNISSGDAAGITVDKEELVNNLLGRIHENSNSTLVVLMHDSAVKITTLEALKEVLPILIQEGYGFSKITTETPQIYFEAYD